MVLNSKELFLNGATLHGKYFLRYAICSVNMELPDVEKGWNIISNAADAVIAVHSKADEGLLKSLSTPSVNGIKVEISR